MKLGTILTAEGAELAWGSVLVDMNKMVAEAYTLANVHVARCCELEVDIPILARSFFQQCLSAVSGGDLHHPRTTMTDFFRESVTLYMSWRGDTSMARRDYISRGWAQVAATRMAGDTQRHLQHNFYRRLKAYVGLRYGLAGQDRYAILQGILSPEYEGDSELVLEYRRLMPRGEDGAVDQRANQLVPVVHYMLEYVEAYNAEHAGERGFEMARTYSLLPTKSGFVCAHFTMLSRGLRALLERSGYRVPEEGRHWNAVEGEWWARMCRLDKVESQRRSFAQELTTDGKSVSILVRKPARGANPLVMGKATAARFSTLWGLDPGRRDMFVATNNHGETISCSSKEFYRDATYTQSNKTIRHWFDYADAEVSEAMRRIPTKKTCSLVKLQEYTEFVIPRFDMLLAFTMRKKFHDLRFWRYCRSRQKLHQLCRRFVDGRDAAATIAGFGDWSCTDFGGTIKKCPGGPSKRFMRELSKVCRLELESEYRTSKVHHGCRAANPGDLVNQYQRRKCRDGVVRTCKVHCVLHCKLSNGSCGITVNRDVNASRNILRTFQLRLQGLPRPPEYCRQRLT